MADEKDHTSFENYFQQKSPVKLHKLSPSKTGQVFFNRKIGSSINISNRPLPFAVDDQIDTKVKDIISGNNPKGLFTICGKMEWLDAQREVRVGGSLKSVRDAKFYDETGSINLAVWETLIQYIKPKVPFRCKNITTNVWNGNLKLTTTQSSSFEEVDNNFDVVHTNPEPLSTVDTSNDKFVLCCPEVVAVKLENYYSCRNIVCRKKIIVEDKNVKFVKCPSCSRKMVTKGLTHTFIVEIVFEKAGKQTNLTLFPNVLNDLDIDKTIIEEELLMLENYDFSYSKKRIVTGIVKHEELI